MNASDYAARVKEADELRTTFYVGIASFTALVWDHIITLGDEIEYIWKRKKGPLIYLFLLNRYLTPLGFIINLFAYFSPVWTPSVCEHFVRYEGSMTVIGINIAALMMLLRIYAMYERKKSVVIFVGVVFCVEFGVNAWLLTHGVAVRHRAGITGTACTMIFDPDKVKGPIASASAWLPLLYDTIVFVLTIKRTYRGVKNPTVGRIMRVLLKEGLLYYSVIFTITLILTLMIVFAPDGLKNLTAQTEYLMTVAMMSRITLHLKKQASKNWDSWGLSLSVDTESSVAPTSRFGRLRFTRSTGVATGGTAMNISVQEYSVMHDDHGEEIQLPMQGHTRSKPTLERHVEWHELAPVRLSIPKESHRRPT
ncbi:hypothetical protein PYCCODRAFT_1402487 [Trametes coccinea BRFM310]|uniref:DUF6533 domain-containing protein n=1 Tax=Trametes coccinea (strain BRFM310) TaxID=1353009 RepID=A0A1Y2J2L0_TRAC3|nr:hypothetical protein PYCCODRAFT_1402487 [Trametes coccinea BRFM310]